VLEYLYHAEAPKCICLRPFMSALRCQSLGAVQQTCIRWRKMWRTFCMVLAYRDNAFCAQPNQCYTVYHLAAPAMSIFVVPGTLARSYVRRYKKGRVEVSLISAKAGNPMG